MTDDTLEAPVEGSATDIDTQQAAAEAAASPEPTLAELAADLGWSPKEQWRGPAEEWQPAHQFLKNTANINRKQNKELKGLKDQVERLVRTSASVVEAQVTERVAAAEAKLAEAVEAGDLNGVKRANAEIDKARKAGEGSNPETAFAASNPWYGKDDDATAYAVSVSQRLAAQGKSIPDQLEAAEAGVRKLFPHLFGEERKPPPVVNGGTTRAATTSNRVKGVADLPPSARKAGEDFVRRKMVPDLAAYAKSYWAENAS